MDFASLEPLEGGWSGETFVGRAGDERVVVRIFADPRHGRHAAEVQASLLRLVRGLLPVPEVLELRRADPVVGTPPLLVTTFLPGTRADLLLPALDRDELRRAGQALGRVAATLGGMPLLDRGWFVDAGLAVAPLELDLPAYVADSLPDLAGLAEVAERAQQLLDEEPRTCLVHADLNPKNLLLDPDTLEVTGVVDWEHAHAGHPFADLGNLVRWDREPAYVDGVLSAYAELRGTPPARALELARAADLFALVDLALRAGRNPVATRAAERLARIAAARDPHAQ